MRRLRQLALLLPGLVLACGGDGGNAPPPPTPSPTGPGPISFDIAVSAGANHGAVLFTVTGGPVDSVTGLSGYEVFHSLTSTGANNNDSLCDFETRGAMHTVTGRTNSLADGTHTVQIIANTSVGTVGFLSDSSLLIGK